MKYQDRVCQQLKVLREIKGLKQIEMAQILNITQCNYSQIENKKRKIDIEQIAIIADEFDLPLDWFFCRDVENTKRMKYSN